MGEGIDLTGLAEPRVGELGASRELSGCPVILAYCDGRDASVAFRLLDIVGVLTEERVLIREAGVVLEEGT